jgi:hypothetical protein
VPGGIQSYARSVRLLVAWAGAHGGVLMPPIAQEDETPGRS